jgi:chromosome segregation ATPase
MEYILGAGVGLFLVLFVLSTALAVRRRGQVQQAEKRLEDHKHQVRELEERLEGKSRQVEQLGTQLDRSRDEIKKAKKKAHDLEKRGRDSRPAEDTELDRIQEEALQEARSQAGKAREEASRASDDCARLREQLDQTKQELKDARAALSSRQADDNRDQQDSARQLKQLQKENRDLKKKLEAAKRKARTDSQVYKVTKSKLDLALEKIQVLEKNAKSTDGATAARPVP